MIEPARSEPLKSPLTKLILDKLLVLILAPFLAPLAMLIALAIALESLGSGGWGPVLHRETRVSAGNPFTLYKFRIFKSASLEKDIAAGANPKNLENDPGNVGRVGRLLKKFGLDELPQFYNILRGDMSFVGPRPKPVPEYEEQLARGFTVRKYAVAGLTGPAQIMKGTSRSEADELSADQRYLDMLAGEPAWRVALFDARVLLATVGVVVGGSGE